MAPTEASAGGAGRPSTAPGEEGAGADPAATTGLPRLSSPPSFSPRPGPELLPGGRTTGAWRLPRGPPALWWRRPSILSQAGRTDVTCGNPAPANLGPTHGFLGPAVVGSRATSCRASPRSAAVIQVSPPVARRGAKNLQAHDNSSAARRTHVPEGCPAPGAAEGRGSRARDTWAGAGAP